MRESIRRVVMLCVIITFGLILIFFDVTLIQLLFMMIVLVIVLPFLIGVLTVEEIRAKLAGKSGFFKRLDEMKFFEKSSKAGEKKAPAKAAATPPPAKTDAKKGPEKTGGFGAGLKSVFSSFGSLGNVLKAKSMRGKKVEDINKMLDKTVSEKVPAPSTSPSPGAQSAGAAAGASLPAPGGAGGLSSADMDADSMLSLSADEFDAGLLDGLEDDTPPEMPADITPDGPTTGSAPDLPVPELSMPSIEGDAPSAGGESSLDEFSGLEGSGGLDAEFGDLDSLSLDGIDADDEMGGDVSVPAATAPAEAPPSGSAPAGAAPAAAQEPIKTAWIASDAPGGGDIMEDQIGVQSDMASFASGAGGTDEDLLSSIASDVKTVKKEKDISLLRELKDFKAPASQIEDELKGMFDQIAASPGKKDKDKTAPDGIK